MGYPSAYRNGARKYSSGGFQNPVEVPPGRRPGKPANDNWPTPANDNDPGAGGGGIRLPKGAAWPGFAADAAEEALTRILPPQAKAAWQLGKALIWFNGEFANRNLAGELQVPAGWKQGCGPNTPPLAYNLQYAFFNTGTATVCGLGGQALGTGSVAPGAKWDRVLYAKAVRQANSFRWFNISWWGRTDPLAKPITYHVPVYPNIFPHIYPDVVPATVTNPMPAYVPAPQGNEVPAYRPLPAKVPAVNPRSSVYVRPRTSASPVVDPGSKPVVVVNPGKVLDPIRRPPGKGVKERKVRARGALAALNGGLGVAAKIYEDAKFYNDVLNAWYNALPSSMRERGLRPDQKALALYRNYDKIDVNKAIIGVLVAVAGEKAGGLIDRARRKTSENLGLSMHITIPTGSAPRL